MGEEPLLWAVAGPAVVGPEQIRGADGGGLPLVPQFQAQIPELLAENLPGFLPAGRAGDPPVGVLLLIFICQNGFKGAAMLILMVIRYYKIGSPSVFYCSSVCRKRPWIDGGDKKQLDKESRSRYTSLDIKIETFHYLLTFHIFDARVLLCVFHSATGGSLMMLSRSPGCVPFPLYTRPTLRAAGSVALFALLVGRQWFTAPSLAWADTLSILLIVAIRSSVLTRRAMPLMLTIAASASLAGYRTGLGRATIVALSGSSRVIRSVASHRLPQPTSSIGRTMASFSMSVHQYGTLAARARPLAVSVLMCATTAPPRRLFAGSLMTASV
jgi:hypothetical protein